MTHAPPSILHWIRAVAVAQIPMATKGLALMLVPLVDNTTLAAHHSIRQVAGKWQISQGTCKRHKATLVAAGLLTSGQGWQLATPTQMAGDLPVNTEHGSGIKSDTVGVSKLITESMGSIKSDTPKGSNMRPFNHHRSTPSLYPNNSTNDDGVGVSKLITENNSRPHRPPGLSDLPARIRPNTGHRKPDGYHWHQWQQGWQQATGKPWPWPVWAQAVLPYLTPEERSELQGAAMSTPRLNLNYCNAIVSRLCNGKSKKATESRLRAGAVPVVVQGRSDDDDAFLDALQGH